jgi:hypothetical protein
MENRAEAPFAGVCMGDGAYILHISHKQTVCCLPFASFLFRLRFDSECEGSTFLRNVCKFLPDYTASSPINSTLAESPL